MENLPAKIPDEVRQAILSRIAGEPSDTKLAKEFGVSRKSIWRLRQAPPRKEAIPPPKVEDLPPVEIPPTPALDLTPELADKGAIMEKGEAPEYQPGMPPTQIAHPNVVPKVDLTLTVLSNYFAVQLLRGENYKEVTYEVLAAAEALKILFRKIQVLDQPSIGTTTFVRFRSDLHDIQAVVVYLENRASIVQIGASFIAHLPNGRKGRYSTTVMCATPKAGFGQIYHGTRIKRWRHQFESLQKSPTFHL